MLLNRLVQEKEMIKFKKNKIIYDLIKFIFILSMFSLFYVRMNYEFNLNPDIGNYLSDYRNANWSYEIGYEFIGYIFRDIIGLKFEQYWSLLLIIQIIILSIIYLRGAEFIYALPNIFLMSEYFFGTTVRYSIGCLLFLLFFRRDNWIEKGKYLSPLLHYGMFFPLAIDAIKNKLGFYLMSRSAVKQVAIIIIICLLSIFLKSIVNTLLPYTRFSYYASSYYLEAKSLLSTVYILIYLILLVLSIRFNNKLLQEKIILLSLSLLIFCIVTAGVAVLSGRVLLLFFLIEPMLINKLLHKKKTCVIGFSMLTLTISKIGLFII